MDARQIRKLQEINANAVPDNLRKQLIREERVYSDEQISKVEEAVRHPDVSPEAKKMAREMLESGALNKTNEVVNNKVALEMDARVEAQVKQAIASGELEPPKKNRTHHIVEENMKKFKGKLTVEEVNEYYRDPNFGHIAT